MNIAGNRIQRPSPESHPAFPPVKANWLLILGVICFSSLAGRAPGCDANLLAILRPALPDDRFCGFSFELGLETIRLMPAMQNLTEAKAVLATTLSAWDRTKQAFKDVPAASRTPDLAGILHQMESCIAHLQEKITKEDLFSAHQSVQDLFFLVIRSLRSSAIPAGTKSLLELALAVNDLQESARGNDLGRLQGGFDTIRTVLQAIRPAIPDVASEAFHNLDFLSTRIPEHLRDFTSEQDKVLLGISMMKNEFAAVLRGMAGKLASASGHN